MGQCCSAPRGASPQQQQQQEQRAPAGVPTGVFGQQRHTLQLHPASGLQLAVTTAQWAASRHPATPTAVAIDESHVFLAMFDGLGEDLHAVPAFCHSRVVSLYNLAARCHPGDSPAALVAVVRQLDEQVAASGSIPPQVKVASGAAAVLVSVDLQSQRCCVASVGGGRCLLGRVLGSFNALAADGQFLHASELGARVSLLKIRAQQGSPEPAKPLATGTRAIGFADGVGTSPVWRPCDVSVVEHQLTNVDGHIIIGSRGLWKEVGAEDTTLRAHFFEQLASVEDALEYAGRADASDASCSPVQHANVAAGLVLYAGSRAAARHDRSATVADLQALPFELSKPAGLPEVSAGSCTETAGPSSCRPALTRRDVHGDLAAIVVSVRWCGRSIDGNLQKMLACAQSHTPVAAAQLATQRRWAQVRMLVSFQRTYRRAILKRWWQAVEQVYKDGRIRAHHAQSSIQHPSKLKAAVGPKRPVQLRARQPA